MATTLDWVGRSVANPKRHSLGPVYHEDFFLSKLDTVLIFKISLCCCNLPTFKLHKPDTVRQKSWILHKFLWLNIIAWVISVKLSNIAISVPLGIQKTGSYFLKEKKELLKGHFFETCQWIFFWKFGTPFWIGSKLARKGNVPVMVMHEKIWRHLMTSYK